MDKEKENTNEHDVIDDDLYEDIDDEELTSLVEEERQKALEKAREDEKNQKTKRPFPKWVFWLIAIAMFINVIAFLPQVFSFPVIDFLTTSANLSTNEEIQEYKEAVVVIDTPGGRGTGFVFTEDGYILTNHHVIEEANQITVGFPDDRLFDAEVNSTYPAIDLAVLKVNGENLPNLTLSERPDYNQGDGIYFIGNPLIFNGVANQGSIIGDIRLNGWGEDVIMIEAPVYQGNSGSPVINQDGQVIGVVFATLQHDTYGNVGLFIPINLFYEYSS